MQNNLRDFIFLKVKLSINSGAQNGELGNSVLRQPRPLTDSLDGYLLIDFPVYPLKILNFENHTIESHFPALY